MASGCKPYESADAQHTLSLASIRPHDSASHSIIRLGEVSREGLARIVPDTLQRQVIMSRMAMCNPFAGMRMPVALKYALIGPPDRDPLMWGGLYYEGQIYQRVAEHLVMNRRTPHFVLAVELGVCSPSCCTMSPEEEAIRKSLVDKKIRSIFGSKPKYPPSTVEATRANIMAKYDVQLLMTERTNGLTLAKYLDRPTTTDDDVRAALFQVLWTVFQMLRLGIMHNDLHLNNVFVDVLPSPITMTYVVDGDDHFAVPVSAFARIYDFDWGFMFNHAPNEMTAKTCRTTGICSEVNDKFDIFLVLTSVEMMAKETGRFPKTLEFVHDVISPSLYNKSTFPGRLCNTVGRVYEDPDKNKCNGPLFPDDDEMWPIDRMMTHDYFAAFRRTVAPPADSPYVFYDGAYANAKLPALRAKPFMPPKLPMMMPTGPTGHAVHAGHPTQPTAPVAPPVHHLPSAHSLVAADPDATMADAFVPDVAQSQLHALRTLRTSTAQAASSGRTGSSRLLLPNIRRSAFLSDGSAQSTQVEHMPSDNSDGGNTSHGSDGSDGSDAGNTSLDGSNSSNSSYDAARTFVVRNSM